MAVPSLAFKSETCSWNSVYWNWGRR